ncbi:uncharacterized protein Fot_15682 [Forsythia ovata]|uniref:Uncharacterized protein n=1 Tax=Forsythia ovata TaxID=205694 RepID=A0ABD1W9U4_9LAMI
MKRQRAGNLRNGTKEAILTKPTKKDSRTAVVTPKEAAVKAVEERKEGTESEVPTAEKMMEWNEWGSLWSAVDEQMSWATCWCPFWDMELMGDANYNELYSDVLWDDDIWDLKGSEFNVRNP